MSVMDEYVKLNVVLFTSSRLQRDSTKIEMRGGRCVSLQPAYLWWVYLSEAAFTPNVTLWHRLLSAGTAACVSVPLDVNAAFDLLASCQKKVAQKSPVTCQKSGSWTDFCNSVWKKKKKKESFSYFQECSLKRPVLSTSARRINKQHWSK